MSGSPQWQLQQAIYARLNGDAALTTTLGAEVYDDVPDAAAFPYVVIGDVTETGADTMGSTGRNVTVTVHVWSRYEGTKEMKLIYSRVDELLDRWSPAVTGWNSVQLQQEMFESRRDPDGITRHGVSRYRVHLHQ